ncbi:uncharacterized membrane protein YkvA (DUF1232 family) [Rhizobium sp. BK275]|uniref:YkvA family protein n=1 Tax=Rhizobium sp. BK275 TaxID=2587077 RepID=UPI001612D131|nr:YkvA family protein [Rhizobium sp. BK275]MBB3388869.1 uncharacterized membrane protein YkvA (DUF1232 family) [Rhizobium sp. BK275]
MKQWLDIAKQWARTIKRDVVALWLAGRDEQTPLAAKLVAGMVAAYALSPIDLIPDFIPILGYFDDLIIVPLGVLWAVRLIPPPLMSEFRTLAASRQQRPVTRAGLIAIMAIWLGVALLLGAYAFKYLNRVG